MRYGEDHYKGGTNTKPQEISHRAKLLSLQELLIDPVYKLKPYHLAALRAVVEDLERTARKEDSILRSKVNVQPHIFTRLVR